jgi:TonB family protein
MVDSGDNKMGFMQATQVAEIQSSFGDGQQKVRRQMLAALTLLLAALVLILVKDRDFWFPPTPVLQSESEPIEEVVPAPNAKSETAGTTTQPVAVVPLKKKLHVPPVTSSVQGNPAATPARVGTSRAVLPPLEVEVVAGDEHRPVQGGSNSVKVDLQPGTSASPTQAASGEKPSASTGVVAAAGRVRLSPNATGIVSRSVEPDYPLLAKQMKVEGAVVLNALIGRDGNIQKLQVLSGPTILSAAAREAVQQWRFRPYLQSGEAVETESRITVNFTIWTR